MKRMILLAALLLAACGSKVAATPAVSPTSSPSNATTPTASSSPVSAHFVDVSPSAAKGGGAQTDPWVDVVAFHEVGLTAGQTVGYRVTGSGTASYTCNGKAVTVAGGVAASKSFTADASGEISQVIAVQPPAAQAGMCTSSYPNGIWAFTYRTMRLLDSTNQVGMDAPDTNGGA